MYRKIVWCYVFVLTLLDITLNTKLSAQGKTHGVTVHDSLIEGITFQEWGGALRLAPGALHFGRAALGAAHALGVSLTNTANSTLHLASVAGTTPDFHASFFEAKTLPPQANTTFSVVYLGRREGPVSAHLYIHTSLGVHKYPVSAIGVASEWGVWPLLGVRVPLNASVEPLLTVHNPTDHTIQVSEVYSSGAWLGLLLPGGGASAPRAAWSVPPRSERPLVRLRLAPPPAPHPLTAYIRIKANITGGALVVCVEARSVAPGEHVSPLQLRLRTRGSRDPPGVFEVAAGNSAAAGVALEAGVWAARCAATPPAPPPPPADPPAPPTANGQSDKGTANGNGVKPEGVFVSLLRPRLEPHEPLTPTAQFTLDYAALWAGAGGAGGAGAWCAGWLRLGRAALPYSVRLLPGTLRLAPAALHFVTANREEALREREVHVHNEFSEPVLVSHLELAPGADQHFQVEAQTPLLLAGGGAALLARVRLRALGAAPLSARLTLRTNLSDYALPLRAYSGRLDMEWEWPEWSAGELRLGVLGASSTRRVRVRLHNAAPAALCVRDVALSLPGASLALEPCAHLRAPPPDHACRCVGAGEALGAWLTVVAPARAGELRGAVALWAGAVGQAPARSSCAVSLRAQPGRLAALPLHLYRAAPYAWASAPLVLESSMALQMRVRSVAVPAAEPALSYEAPAEAPLVGAGRHAVGTVLYAPERLCAPHCYTGLDITTTEGAAWLRRGAGAGGAEGAALRADAALQRARHAQFRAAPASSNVSLLVHTTHVLALAARGAAAACWPRLAAARAAAGLAPVAGAAPLRLRARNPSRSHALLLQAVLGAPQRLAGEALAPGARARHAFALRDWRATRGAVRVWRHHNQSAPLLLLAPDAEVEIELSFTPDEPTALAAYLYLRNNLTIMEGVQLTGRGAYPSFELAGRRPGTGAPLLFEVSECGAGGGTVRRTLLARNTGQVAVRLRDWRLAGQPCQARGFRLTPCAPLALAPNESRALTVAFTPDYTLARVAAELTARTDTARAAFLLRAAAPARLLAPCRAQAPRPPWEPRARAAAALLAFAALALVLAAAALDAERELRRARAARPPPAPHRPLDLRALAQPPPPPPAPRARRRRAPRPAPAPDAQHERRAFERWRAGVLARDPSSDDADREPPPAAPPPLSDGYEADPETEDRPQGSGDDDALSTGSGSASASSSSPTVDDHDELADEGDEPEREPPHERPAPTTGDESPPIGVSHLESAGSAGDAAPRAVRARRDASEAGRRARGEECAPRPRPAGRPQARKDKLCKRRPERAAASPPRAPLRLADARAPGSLRWGASWSSVVAARAPSGAAALAPIGSDVRRRAEPDARVLSAPSGDHSLFYFNGDATHSTHACRDSDFSWRPPPPVERPAFTPARDFLDEPNAVGSGSFRSLNSVWGSTLEPRPAAAAWLWGAYAEAPGAGAGAVGAGAVGTVRPPPGFGAPPRPVRPYDPFRSLASIWAPGALDWRSEPAPASPDESANN